MKKVFSDLIFYEIGSYLRKYKEIRKVFNNEIKEMMELEEVRLNYKILDLSIKENLSYYDAVYLYLARQI